MVIRLNFIQPYNLLKKKGKMYKKLFLILNAFFIVLSFNTAQAIVFKSKPPDNYPECLKLLLYDFESLISFAHTNGANFKWNNKILKKYAGWDANAIISEKDLELKYLISNFLETRKDCIKKYLPQLILDLELQAVNSVFCLLNVMNQSSFITVQNVKRTIPSTVFFYFKINQAIVDRVNSFSPHTTSVSVNRGPSIRPLDKIHFGDYYALIIGINNYKYFKKLSTAKNDAKAIANILRKYYLFKEVKLLINSSRLDVISELDKFRMKLKESDNFIIYFAGHGFYDQYAERGYWIPVDAQKNTTASWISSADITDKLKAISSKHILVISDSCYSGTFPRSSINVKLDHIEKRYFDSLHRTGQSYKITFELLILL